MRFSMWIFILLFVLTMVYLGYSVVTYGGKWTVSTANPRTKQTRDIASAGSIYDRDGVLLAASDGDTRVYNDSESTRRALSHVVGDVYGKSVGAETIFLRQLYTDKQDIKLTVSSKLSKYIYRQLDDRTGSVVVMNYKTGEILASVSIPTFDPETLQDEEPTGTSLVDRSSA